MNHEHDEPTQPLYLEELADEMHRRSEAEARIPAGSALPAPDPAHPVDRADVIGEGARSLAAWSGRFLLMVAAAAVTLYGLSYLSGAIIPVLMALLLASVLYPIVGGLKRIGIPTGIGAIVALLTGVAVIGGLVSLIAPAVMSQWSTLADQTIKGIRQVQVWLEGPPFNLHNDQLTEYLNQFVSWLQGHSEDLVSFAVTISGSVGSIMVTTAMTLVIVFFMLKDGHKFVGWTRSVVGRRGGFHVTELFTRLWTTLSGYIRTQAIVSAVDAVFIGLGLWIFGVPLAFPIAVLTFMAGFIPIVGAFAAGGVAMLVALVTGGPFQALIVLAIVVAVQQIEGNILQPLLQSRVMQLHPVIVILAVLLGGGWFSILGAFLAVPVAASGAVVFRYLSDLIDLRTGDRTAADIKWATDEGHVVGGQSEQSAAFFQNLVQYRLRANPFRGSATEQEDTTTIEVDEPKRKLRDRLKGLGRKGRDKDAQDRGTKPESLTETLDEIGEDGKA